MIGTSEGAIGIALTSVTTATVDGADFNLACMRSPLGYVLLRSSNMTVSMSSLDVTSSVTNQQLATSGCTSLMAGQPSNANNSRICSSVTSSVASRKMMVFCTADDGAAAGPAAVCEVAGMLGAPATIGLPAPTIGRAATGVDTGVVTADNDAAGMGSPEMGPTASKTFCTLALSSSLSSASFLPVVVSMCTTSSRSLKSMAACLTALMLSYGTMERTLPKLAMMETGT
mmetsp:Transcript_15570/g.43710  ORF Transcript_15570/g.43710 Transcript_15570/m.43710 type:complete len:229 (-) Transcript_15570:541-1227(-)